MFKHPMEIAGIKKLSFQPYNQKHKKKRKKKPKEEKKTGCDLHTIETEENDG